MNSSKIGTESGGTRRRKSPRAGPAGDTRVVRGAEEVRRTMISFVKRAAESDYHSYVYSITDRHGPKDAVDFLETLGPMMKASPQFVRRFITDIQRDNLQDVKRILVAGVQVRHIEGNRIAFSVSPNEYVNHFQHGGEPGASGPSGEGSIELVWSSDADLVSQMRETFDVIWDSAIPAEARIKQLEVGLDPGETRIVSDIREATNLGWELVDRVKREVLIILASGRTIERNTEMFQKLMVNAKEKGIDVRVLVPSTQNDEQTQTLPGIQWRQVRPMSTGIAIYDRESMLITQYVDPEAADPSGAYFSNIYSTNKQTIAGMASVFEALWSESELRENDRKSRKQAELLQDILSHDIRNYSQAALAWAEILKDKRIDDPESQKIADGIIDAITGATELVNKAGQLGRILSYRDKALHPVDLPKTMERALEVTRKAYPGKSIDHRLSVRLGQGREGSPQVLADNFLDDVFVNLYSNATRYTPGDKVAIETVVEDLETDGESGSGRRQLRISVIDRGRGISDDAKRTLFGRYLKTAEGRGLGLSIVYSLVVERYAGRLSVRDRLEKDPSSGTCFELTFQAAESRRADPEESASPSTEPV